MTDTLVRCSFYIRTPVDTEKGSGRGFYYDSVNISDPHGSRLRTANPPELGDVIALWDYITKTGGAFQVIDRMWLHSSYGSDNWPYAQDMPSSGPLLDIIVVAHEGPFRNQVSRNEDDE